MTDETGLGRTATPLGGSSERRIVRLDASRREEGLSALLGGDRASVQRFLAFAAQTHLRLDGLWACLSSEGRAELAILAAPSAGRTATLFATAARSAGDVPTLAALVATAHRELHDLDVDLAQALIDPHDTLQLDAFDRSGMSRLATLSYMERPLSRRTQPSPPAWPDDIRAETWDPRNRAELIAALERTYVDTLDCPALAGLRRGEDVLEGHLHSGRYEPALWTIVRFASGAHANSIAGLCLLNGAHEAAGSRGAVELVYLGLVPEARRRGLGRLLLQHGLSLLGDRAERNVLLAVDERNEPASRLYRAAGFRFAQRRVAFIRPVQRST
ncbi:MAG: GNAT family N-acetyltransferase [Phycisphaerales bacterium]